MNPEDKEGTSWNGRLTSHIMREAFFACEKLIEEWS